MTWQQNSGPSLLRTRFKLWSAPPNWLSPNFSEVRSYTQHAGAAREQALCMIILRSCGALAASAAARAFRFLNHKSKRNTGAIRGLLR
jgi:hypothetical protein